MSGKKISNFRDRFNELIESSTKSRTVIAQEFGVAKQTISAWITGQSSPRLPVASALADYFEVNIDWLMGYDVPKYKSKDDAPDPEPAQVDPDIHIVSSMMEDLPQDQKEQIVAIVRAYVEHQIINKKR